MGRAMLIICAGLFIALGIVSVSTSEQGKTMTENAAVYANETKALNAAHTAIQIAMQKLNENNGKTWAKSHDSSNPWETTIDGAETTLYIDYMHESANYWDPDSIRLVSKAETIFEDSATTTTYEGQVTSVYLKAPFSNLVPEFKSALTIATNQVAPFNAGGSASISGNAPSGSGCEDKPVMTIAEQAGGSMDSTSYASEMNDIETSGSPKVKVDKDLNYQPTDELIARLEDSPDRVNVGTDYKDSLGTASDPGVFFIEEGTNLTGKQSSGYGIIVVKSGAQMQYDGELKVAGNFEFNGLIIFENAYDFQGKGTPTVNGSVLIGNTEDYTDDINVDISGNIHLQYDCQAEEYAKMAASDAVDQYKYTRVVTLQQTQSIKN
ncbi:hypothetical protein [Fodinibius saliphilus]|uniref:hypothetical protein n=1 Tax=Fodinibius saliphilus TaxID=1920650 RepID=UPI00110941F2|nr:hypothetical protein [Fodinibius saliphilus]